MEVLKIALSKSEPANSGAARATYWAITYISEAAKKWRVFFEQFDVRTREIERQFSAQGPAAKRWWEYVRSEGILNPTRDPGISLRFSFLSPILAQMTHLTTFAIKLLQSFSLLSSQALAEEFQKHGVLLSHDSYNWFTNHSWTTAAKLYNEAVDRMVVPGLSLVRTKLPCELTSDDGGNRPNWGIRILETVEVCFSEVGRSLREYCPEYKVVEGDLPYAPQGNTRVIRSGGIENDMMGAFVLVIDASSSSGSAATRAFDELAMAMFQRFKDKGVFFEDLRDSRYIACSYDPSPLVDIAIALALHGAELIKVNDPFSGSLKGLSYGTVTTIRKDGTSRAEIRAIAPPSLLASAFDMLNGIDREIEAAKKNASLVVEADAMSKLTSQIKFSVMKNAILNCKEFRGECSFISLF